MITNPLYDPYCILMKVYGEKAYLKQAIADTYIEELYRARTVKAAYGVLENDEYFSFCIAHYAAKSPKQPVRVLLKVALYFLLVLQKKRYAVTDFAVELCKKLGKGGAAGFVNAFLRRFSAEEIAAAMPGGRKGLLIQTGYPEFAYKKLEKEYGNRAGKIAAAKSGGVSVRFLPPYKTEGAYLDRAKEKGVRFASTPFVHSYVFDTFVRDEGYDRGEYTFQSVGSQAISDCIAPCKTLLDACAAPGGKSVLLSEKCEKVVSFELHAHRAALIEAYARRARRENVEIHEKDSRIYDPEYEKAFEAVLCDVPCSGFGTVCENPDIKILKNESVFSSVAEDQRKILAACANYVKEGGMLYYSTCSLFECENDGVVGEFLSSHPDFRAEKIGSALPHEKKKFGLQFLPDTAFGAGFYVSAMRRAGGNGNGTPPEANEANEANETKPQTEGERK